MIRSTHTYVTMAVSQSAYDEIKTKLLEAGYDHVFDGTAMDMHGIALTPPEPKPVSETSSAVADVQQIMADFGIKALAGDKKPRHPFIA